MPLFHCNVCGYEGSRTGPLSQNGSDVVPMYKYPECGDVAAIDCLCDGLDFSLSSTE